MLNFHGSVRMTRRVHRTPALVPAVLALAVITLSALASGQRADNAKKGGRTPAGIPIMTWPGPDASLLTPAAMRLVAGAGFSVNMSFLGGRRANLQALDLAGAAGLRLMIQDDRISKLVEDPGLPLDVLAGVAADYKDHPAFFGYFVTDEPNAARFGRLAAIVRRLEELDPGHPAYINLFPTYANGQQLGAPTYEDYVGRFLDTVRPPFLSFDHYPLTVSGLHSDYYRNLEIVRQQAIEHGLDPWAFALATPHAVYLPPTAGRLRFQLWSDIAYGAKGLQYFTFATPTDTDYDWGCGLMDRQGRPGPAYSLAGEVNAEIRSVESLILRWRSAAVYHSEPVPEGARPLAGEGPVLSAEGAPLVIGVFSDGPVRYVIFVNRDYEKKRTATVCFPPGIREVREVAIGRTVPARIAWPAEQAEHVCVLEFGAGAARIFRVQ